MTRRKRYPFVKHVVYCLGQDLAWALVGDRLVPNRWFDQTANDNATPWGQR